MTSRQKRALRAQGLDPHAIHSADVARRNAEYNELVQDVDFSGLWDGKVLNLDGLTEEQAIAVQTAAAILEANGKPIPHGVASFPAPLFDRMVREVVKYAVRANVPLVPESKEWKP
jgi:hypothetical protein